MSETAIKGGNRMLVASIIMGIIGFLISLGGYSIRNKGDTSFIAGNNKVFIPRNEKKLADRIGWVVLAFGIETIVFPIVFYFIKVIEGYHFVILAVLHLFVVFIYMFLDQMEVENS